MSARQHLFTQTSIDERHGVVFAPEGHVNNHNPAEPFAVLDILDGLLLTAHDPALLDRLAKTCTDLAADLRTAVALAAEGDAS
jgi:hypothetical protein